MGVSYSGRLWILVGGGEVLNVSGRTRNGERESFKSLEAHA